MSSSTMDEQKIADIRIHKINEASVRVLSNYSITRDIKRYVEAKVKGYQFSPAYKQGRWDGRISAFKNGVLPIGLVPHLRKFAQTGGYSIYEDFDDGFEFTPEEFQEFVKTLQMPFPLYDYQVNAAFNGIKQTKLNINIPTGGGKCLRNTNIDIEISDEVYDQYFKHHEHLLRKSNKNY